MYIKGPVDDTTTALVAVDIFTFFPLNVDWTFRGVGVRQWTLEWGCFGQKQTDTFP